MRQIEPTANLGALVAERPARAELFERLRFDYCCGGRQTLAEACAQRGLDVDTVRELVAALDGAPLRPTGPLEDTDWRRASLTELSDHIVSVHHAGLRRDLPRIAELLATVVRVHGADHPELRDLQRGFAGMRSELEQLLELEERALFPAPGSPRCAAAARARLPPARPRGEQRALPTLACARRPGGVVSPKPRRSIAARGGGGREPTPKPRLDDLPLCCQAWVAEQARLWASQRRQARGPGREIRRD